MAKKNWRDSGTDGKRRRSGRTGWSGSSGARGLGTAGKAFFLLVSAGLLGLLIAFFVRRIPPELQTRVLFFDSYPSTQGDVVLSSNAFAGEVFSRLSENTNVDLVATKENLTTFESIELEAFGPQENVVMMYVYSDIFLDDEGQPILLAHDRQTGQARDSGATQSPANVELRSFLRMLCEKEIEEKDPLVKNQRIVILDCGRLDATAFSNVHPQAIADSVTSVINMLKESRVPNSDNLWVLLAIDNYQLGWTSPEVNGSVFGHFFSLGLTDLSSTDNDQIVTLEELTTYVRESVARWVKNYRDAVQTPVLLCGGNLADANKVQLIHSKAHDPNPASSIDAQDSIDSGLWQKAAEIRQPHRRKMICSRLVRLEQLRHCQSREFELVKDQVNALLRDATGVNKNNKHQSCSVFERLSEAQLVAATTPDAITDLREYLKPRKTVAPKSPDSASVGQDKPDSEKLSDDSDEPDDVQRPKQKTPGRHIMHLIPQQLCALTYQFIVDRELDDDLPFGRNQLKECLDLIRRGDVQQECDSLVEMQFLDLLYNDLPWGYEGFDPSVFHYAIKCAAISQSLLEGRLRSPAVDTVTSITPDQVWANWRHFDSYFESLENRRRIALDKAIAAAPDAVQDFRNLETNYHNAGSELSAIIQARENANDLAFVIPYLKSFVLRDAVYRGKDGNEADDFFVPLDEIKKLESIAVEMILLLSRNSMDDDARTKLKTLDKQASLVAQPIREKFSQLGIELSRLHTASKYVFETQNLLMTPIPEWITRSSGSPSARQKIVEELDDRLNIQQLDYLDANKTGQEGEDDTDVDAFASAYRDSATRKLKAFETKLSQSRSFETLATGVRKNELWGDVQSSLEKLPRIEQLANGNPESGAYEFSSTVELADEILRLDNIDRKIRLSGRSIGLSLEARDIFQQQTLLYAFDAQQRLLVRAIRDFWGAGNVSGFDESAPPFLRQTQTYADNLQEIAKSTNDFQLNGSHYQAYDAESLELIGNNLLRQAEQLWKEFSGLIAEWQFNGTRQDEALKLDESMAENQLGMSLAELDNTLARTGLFPALAAANKLVVGQRVNLDRDSYYDVFEIPRSLQTGKAWGTVHFRGHQFKKNLAISRKIFIPLPQKTFTFKPEYRANQESLVTVENDIENEVDLIFLLDCSQSIKGEMQTIKNATREIMLELSKDKRFHIGLAAFGHRGEYTDQRTRPGGRLVLDEDGKLPYHGHHPFDDWEMLAKPPRKVSDEQSVNHLWDFYLSKLNARGYTPLYYSISETLPFFSNTARNSILVVVTDGVNSQVPTSLRNMAAALPKDPITGRDKSPTTKQQLEDLYSKKYDGKVKVLVLQTKDVDNDMPANFETVKLGSDTTLEMKNKIFDVVGRYQFSVTENNAQPRANDRRRMGETIPVKVEKKSNYIIKTHGVPVESASSDTVTLYGGEDHKYIFTKNGLRVDQTASTRAADSFLRPRIEKPIQIGGANYRVGRMQSNQLDNIRIGFSNNRGLSEYPARVWARVRDEQGREFDMTRASKDFSRVPTYNFRLPSGMDSKSIDMTLFIKSESSPEADQDNREQNSVELSGEGSLTLHGLTMVSHLKQGSQSRYTVTVSGSKPITQAFHLDCPNSIPIGDDRKLTIRNVTFGRNRFSAARL